MVENSFDIRFVCCHRKLGNFYLKYELNILFLNNLNDQSRGQIAIPSTKDAVLPVDASGNQSLNTVQNSSLTTSPTGTTASTKITTVLPLNGQQSANISTVPPNIKKDLNAKQQNSTLVKRTRTTRKRKAKTTKAKSNNIQTTKKPALQPNIPKA